MPSFLDTLDQINQGLQGWSNSPQGMQQILSMRGVDTASQADIIGQQQAIQEAQYRQQEQQRIARARELMATMEPNDAAKLRELMALDPAAAANFLKMYEQKAPSSTIGKIQADIDAGLIDPATGMAALKKATTIAPVYDPVSGNMIYAGGDGFNAPEGGGMGGGVPSPSGGSGDIPPEFNGNRKAYQSYLEALAAGKAKEGSEENVVKKQKADVMRQTALSIVNELLADQDAVKAITGTYDSQTPTILPSSAEAETKIKRLRSILTAENLGLMTGVLSETDLKVIADIAGGGLNQNRSDEGMIEELKTLQKKFGGGSGKAVFTHPQFGDVTEDDIVTTMQENNMTREQVLQQLGAQ